MPSFTYPTCASRQLFWCPYLHHGKPMSNPIWECQWCQWSQSKVTLIFWHIYWLIKREYGCQVLITGIITVVWVWWKPRMLTVLVNPLKNASPIGNPFYGCIAIIVSVLDIGRANVRTVGKVGKLDIKRKIAGERRRERKRIKRRKVQMKWM